MSVAHLVARLLPFVWMVWAVSSTALALRGFRRDVLSNPPLRRVLWIALAAATVAFAATFVLPARIDSSGLLELAGGNEPWKGAAGEALLQAAGYLVSLSLRGIVVFTRLCVLPACALAVLVSAGRQSNKESWIRAGLDVRSLLVVAALMITPSFLYGTLGVFNFWFFCAVSLAMLLAWQDAEKAPSTAGRTALVSSVLLIGFARPETIAGGLVLAAVLTVFAWRKRDYLLLALALIALVFLGFAAPSVSGYLADRMRNQPLLTDADATGEAPLWQLPWIAIRRIGEHAPVNLLVLLVALHAVGVLAVVRIVRMIRTRSFRWAEVAALALIVSEFLAIGVHREGFTRYIKYGQLLVVPCWYLATGIWYAGQADRRLRKVLIGSFVAGAVVMSASLAFNGAGLNRCSLPAGRTVQARRDDEVLLWTTTPRWVNSVCGASPAVIVVGLDDRLPREGNPIEDAFSKPSCESERWPIEHLLRRGGCPAVSAYPDLREPMEKALFDSGSGLLCRPVPFQSIGQGPQRPAYAIVTHYLPESGDKVRAAIAAHPDCAWEIVESTPSAMLLRAR